MHRWNTRWRESLFSSVVLYFSFSSMFVSYTVHTPPLTPSFLLHGNQPKHLLFARKRVIASDLSVRGSSACTLCPVSWVNSYAVVVWARPGVLIVTTAPNLGQVSYLRHAPYQPHLFYWYHSLSVLQFIMVCMCVPQLCVVDAFTRHHSLFVSSPVDISFSYMHLTLFLYLPSCETCIRAVTKLSVSILLYSIGW